MSLATRVARRFLATISDSTTLDQLVEMEVESLADELPHAERKKAMDRASATPLVREKAKAWDNAVEHVLTDWCAKNMDDLNLGEGPLKHAKTPAAVVDVMMELRGGAGYLYFMEHEGHGVGTWDGDWDVLFKTPKQTIKTLSQHVLGATRQPYKGLKDALMDAALEAMPEEASDGARYSYDRRGARPTREAAALDMDLAKTFCDAWSSALIGKLAPKFISPAKLGTALRDQWFDLVGAGTRSLQWRSSKWMKPAEWAEQMKTICPEYNGFHAGKAGGWLARFSGVELQPAREYSVCVYLKGNPEEISQIATQAARAIHADEVGMQDDGTLRLWWD